MIKVTILNRTDFNLYPDLDGKAETKDTVIIGPRAKVEVELPSEKRFTELSKEFKNRAVLRKA